MSGLMLSFWYVSIKHSLVKMSSFLPPMFIVGLGWGYCQIPASASSFLIYMTMLCPFQISPATPPVSMGLVWLIMESSPAGENICPVMCVCVGMSELTIWLCDGVLLSSGPERARALQSIIG